MIEQPEEWTEIEWVGGSFKEVKKLYVTVYYLKISNFKMDIWNIGTFNWFVENRTTPCSNRTPCKLMATIEKRLRIAKVAQKCDARKIISF